MAKIMNYPHFENKATVPKNSDMANSLKIFCHGEKLRYYCRGEICFWDMAKHVLMKWQKV